MDVDNVCSGFNVSMVRCWFEERCKANMITAIQSVNYNNYAAKYISHGDAERV